MPPPAGHRARVSVSRGFAGRAGRGCSDSRADITAGGCYLRQAARRKLSPSRQKPPAKSVNRLPALLLGSWTQIGREQKHRPTYQNKGLDGLAAGTTSLTCLMDDDQMPMPGISLAPALGTAVQAKAIPE